MTQNEVFMRLKGAVIGCIDVGKNPGWFIWDPEGEQWSAGTCLDKYTERLGKFLEAGRLCIVGFEAPSFLPRSNEYDRLFRARYGAETDGQSRPWSVVAGKAATWRVLPLVPAFLAKLRKYAPNTSGDLDFKKISPKGSYLLLFEAFVTQAPAGATAPSVPKCVKNETKDVWDAAVAVFQLREQIVNQTLNSAVSEKIASISLFGSALLAAGWSEDVKLACSIVYVVRAFKPEVVATEFTSCMRKVG